MIHFQTKNTETKTKMLLSEFPTKNNLNSVQTNSAQDNFQASIIIKWVDRGASDTGRSNNEMSKFAVKKISEIW